MPILLERPLFINSTEASEQLFCLLSDVHFIAPSGVDGEGLICTTPRAHLAYWLEHRRV